MAGSAVLWAERGKERKLRTSRVLGALAVLAVASGCAQVPPTQGSPSQDAAAVATREAEPSPTPTEPTCADIAATLTVEQQVGQLLMVGVHGALDGTERELITTHEIGSVILMGNYDTSVQETRELTQPIADLGVATPVLIAVDQEGGLVRRLRGLGFDEMPSAAEQAKLSKSEFASDAAMWAEQLRSAGVNLNLAPVADTVPANKSRTNEPIGRLDRGYGSDPEKVAERVSIFVSEFRDAGVGTSLKHFPNLGEVTGNTDFTQKVTDTVTQATSASLKPFRAGIQAGADSVMLSTAIYSKIDPDTSAAFSSKVVAILRDDLSFDKVIISDDLGVAAAAKTVPARKRALKLVQAGGDMALTVDPKLASAMAEGLVEAVSDDESLAALVTESAGRVLAMKSTLGLGDCRVE